jgi:hypothetical protein
MAKAQSMDKSDRAKAARRKRREDPVADREGKGGKPVNVATEAYITEKNAPTNPALWSRAKSLARQKFDVYPSAYANGWAAKYYKSKGGGWKSVSEEVVDEKCWDGYKMVGTKKKGNKIVPNCVAEDIDTEFLASLAAALNGTPGQVTPSTGTKARKGVENVSRGDDEKRKEIVNVQREKSKTNSIAKQANIRYGLDESFKIATAAGYSQFLTAADCGIKMQGGFAYHPSVLPSEDEEEANDDQV